MLASDFVPIHSYHYGAITAMCYTGHPTNSCFVCLCHYSSSTTGSAIRFCGYDVMVFPLVCWVGRVWRATCGWNSRRKMVLHVGERKRTAVCPGGAVLSTPLFRDWSRGGHSAASHPCHLAFPQRPAPVSRQMTWFDTPAGAIGPANVSARSSLKKKIEKAISWGFFSFLIKCDNGEVMGKTLLRPD